MENDDLVAVMCDSLLPLVDENWQNICGHVANNYYAEDAFGNGYSCVMWRYAVMLFGNGTEENYEKIYKCIIMLILVSKKCNL